MHRGLNTWFLLTLNPTTPLDNLATLPTARMARYSSRSTAANWPSSTPSLEWGGGGRTMHVSLPVRVARHVVPTSTPRPPHCARACSR